LAEQRSLLRELRRAYHRKICDNILGHRPGSTVFSNADTSSIASKAIAKGMAEHIGRPFCENPPSGQAAGTLFGEYTKEYLKDAFLLIGHLRPGDWDFSTRQAPLGLSFFDQYEHLAQLQEVLEQHNELRAMFGGDYFIKPDVVIGRIPVRDEEIDRPHPVLGDEPAIAMHTPLRAANHDGARPILHASVSCKWTMRSDRSQNTRTEALNLIRNRKGNTPHIVAVTIEPLPSRLASIAMGTGDVDCTYHAALYELQAAVEEIGAPGRRDQQEVLEMLVGGRRLRDISDLPFDLAV
jgi:NgoMIV restriction enzyme